MTKQRVVTDDAKFNFIMMIKKLGQPDIGLNKLLGFNIYEHFFTEKCVRNVETRSLILYLLDFGRKCKLNEAEALYHHLLEYCRNRPKWEKNFKDNSEDQMVILMEYDWTSKLVEVLQNLQKSKTDLNFRMKHHLTELNLVYI